MGGEGRVRWAEGGKGDFLSHTQTLFFFDRGRRGPPRRHVFPHLICLIYGSLGIDVCIPKWPNEMRNITGFESP